MADDQRKWDRRDVLLGAGAASLGVITSYAVVQSLSRGSSKDGVKTSIAEDQQSSAKIYDLTAGPAEIPLLGAESDPTAIWGYNGDAPGPLLSARQGDELAVNLTNRLDQPTTIHWHGIRLPNAMDGVPGLTQAPVQPGETFTYRFPLEDAGTFWYHPHANSAEQLGRGLSGVLIVEEPEQPDVDRDILWVLDDWRIGENGVIADGFYALHDMSHAGRMGNVATINGRVGTGLRAFAGERIRLRLVNVANARVFGLQFDDHAPWVMAMDGHPVSPTKVSGPVTLAPGERVDLFMDMTGDPKASFRVRDVHYARFAYTIGLIQYEDESPKTLRDSAPSPLPANPVAVPDVTGLEPQTFAIQGGAMGRLGGAELNGEYTDLRTLAREHGIVWAINGKVPMLKSDMSAKDYGGSAPLAEFKLGETAYLRLKNDTRWEHPMHLHGFAFHILKRSGAEITTPPIRDTVLLAPGEEADIAFVADNPGDWMFHCHVLEHQASGMMGFIRVS
ncbi:MAG: multicopper oxidase family protein [Magnetovibrionaceae bacterium]